MSKYSNLFPYIGEFTAWQGSNTDPSIRFENDNGTGMYSSGPGVVNFISDNTDILSIDKTLHGIGGVDILGATSSSLLFVDDGTVEAPSISFKNEKDTGLYRSGNNSVGLSISGENVLVARHQGNDNLTYKSTVVFDGVTSIRLPAGPTGYRPVAEAEDGDIRYNSTLKQFEGYTDGEWITFGRPKDVNLVNALEEPDGVLTVFTLPNNHEYVSGTLSVYVNGLLEDDITYISSTQFEIPDPAPEAGDVITLSYTRRDHF